MTKNLSLLVQVYNGNAFFKECLESVLPCVDRFHKIYISISKSDAMSEDVQIANSFKEKVLQDKVVIFTWNKIMTAIEHGQEFYKQIFQKDSDTDFFMILCHDDILLPEFSEKIDGIMGGFGTDTVLDPARSFYKNDFDKSNFMGTYYGLLSYPLFRTTKEDFANKCFDRAPDTSVSGLIYSKIALKEFISILPLFAYGYRSEYVQMFNKEISFVQGTNVPLVGIREHDNSEGAKYFEKKMLHDEILYLFYICYVTNDLDFKERIKNRIKKFYPKYILCRLFYLKLSFILFLRNKDFSIFLFILVCQAKGECRLYISFAKRCVKFILRKMGLWRR